MLKRKQELVIMDQDKKPIEKTPDSKSQSPATPQPTHIEEELSATARSSMKKRVREDVPTLRRSVSAAPASTSKLPTKSSAMGPPRTPIRVPTKTRVSEATPSKGDTGKLDSKVDSDGKAMTTAQPANVSSVPAEERYVESSPIDKEKTSPDDSTTEPHLIDLLSDTPQATSVQAKDASGPEVPIEEFDWDDLERRHFDKLQAFELQEQAVYEDLHRLNMMFQTWAGAGQAKETERSSKRLKTRISFVQHQEAQLSEKRQQFLHVVNAFQSALSLLERN